MRKYGAPISRGLAALEDDENKTAETPEATPEAVEVAETGKELAEAEQDVNEVADDNAEADEQVAVAEDGVEALEQLRDSLESFRENGGLNRDGAVLMQQHIAFINRMTGVNASRRLPTFESFHAAGTRLSANNVSVEGLTQGIKDAWKKILEMIKQAMQWIRDKWMGVFGAAEKLASRAKALSASIEKDLGTKSIKAGGDGIEDSGLVGKLWIGAKTADGGEAAQVIADTTDKMVNAWSKGSNKIYEAVQKVLDAAADNKKFEPTSEEQKALDEVSTYLKTFATDLGCVAAPDSEITRDGCETTRIATELPGGMGLYMFTPAATVATEAKGDTPPAATEPPAAEPAGDKPAEGGDKALSADDKAKIKSAKAMRWVGGLDAFKKSNKAPTAAKLAILDKGQMIAVCTAVAEAATRLASYKTEASKIGDRSKKIEAAVTKLANKADQSEGNAVANATGQAVATGCKNLITQPIGSWFTYVINTGTAYLNYVQKSMAQYK